MKFVTSPSFLPVVRLAKRSWRGLLPVAITVLLSQSVHGAIYFTEGFNYPTGNLMAWANGSGTHSNGVQVTSPGIILPTLQDTTPSGNKISITPFNDGSSSLIPSTNFVASPYITSGTVYCSFLLNCTTAPTGNQYLIGMVAGGGGLTGSGDPILLYPNTGATAGNYKLTIRHTGNSAVGATNDMAPNVTNFIVLKYTFGSGGWAQIFINPTPGGTEPTNASASCPSSAPGGTDPANLGNISIKAQSTNSEGNWDIDTIRVGSTWADVAPASGACLPATVNSPVNQTNYAGLTVIFSVAAGGSSPTYQWQTNSGASWINIVSATNTSYLTPAIGLTNSGSPANGTQYRCAVSVSCGGGSSTNSPAATLTVLPAPNYTGVIVSNAWKSGLFTNPPPPQYSDCGVLDGYGDIESGWFALGSTTATGLSAVMGAMTASPQTNSRTWLTYFTSNGVVHLSPGELIRATTVFQPQGVVNNTNGNLVFGLFNSLAPTASRLTGNSSSGSSGASGVQGYAFAINFSSTFHTNIFTNNLSFGPFAPIEFRVRTNLGSTDFMGASADYTSLGVGGSTNGAPGFVDNAVYTNVFSVARNTNGTVSLACQFIGPGFGNLTFTTNDTSGNNYIDFDTFGLRPANNTNTATNLIFTLFELQTAPASPTPLSFTNSGTNIILAWTNSSFGPWYLYAAPQATGTYSLVSATNGYTTPKTNSQRYFRLRNQ